MEVRIVTIPLPLFHNHTFVYKKFVKRHKDIAPTLVTYACIALFQCLYNIGIALYDTFSLTIFQRFTVLLLRQFRK